MAQQIPVRPCLFEPLVTVIGFLPDRQGQCTVRPALFDLADDRFHPFIRIVRILAALQHKSTKSQFIAIFTAGQDLFFRQPVAIRISVTLTDSTVIAVIFTVIGKFNEPSGKYLIPVVFLPKLHGPGL